MYGMKYPANARFSSAKWERILAADTRRKREVMRKQ
jgi:hypothetical protein